jgi:hypothetical protein
MIMVAAILSNDLAAARRHGLHHRPFTVVIGFANWHSALGRRGMTAKMNRAVLAGEPNTTA